MPGGAAWKDAVSLHDLEALARAAMDPEAYDFVAGGAGDEVTLRENAAAFAGAGCGPGCSGVSSGWTRRPRCWERRYRCRSGWLPQRCRGWRTRTGR